MNACELNKILNDIESVVKSLLQETINKDTPQEFMLKPELHAVYTKHNIEYKGRR